MFATALFYGDSMITPAISVLSAVEGLTTVNPALEPFVIPIAVVILIGLFAIQARGTARVGLLFGPVMLFYFATLAVLGVMHVVTNPSVIVAMINPMNAVYFFTADFVRAFIAMGSVVLAVTGAEALYADMGHFGRKPIRVSWLYFVLPALLLNYMGQGAMILSAAPAEALAKVKDPFFYLAPDMLRLPLVLLATAATVIASQAVISGAFSVTQQAIQLGFVPRLRITHTSEAAAGQIYIPVINWALMIMVILLVLSFRSSSNLAAAYGIAVVGAMLIDSVLHLRRAAADVELEPLSGRRAAYALLPVDFSYLSANLLKIPAGGWFPLLVGAIAFTFLTTWAKGRQLMINRMNEASLPMEIFIKSAAPSAARVPGTAVFMTSSASGVPHALLHNLKHNKVLHERVILLTVRIEDVPYVAAREARRDRGLRLRLLPRRPALRLHGGDRRPRRARPAQGLRAAVQDDGHQLLPRAADVARLVAAGNGDLAREAVRLDAAQRRKRDGILQAPDQSRGRARKPGRNLNQLATSRIAAPWLKQSHGSRPSPPFSPH